MIQYLVLRSNNGPWWVYRLKGEKLFQMARWSSGAEVFENPDYYWSLVILTTLRKNILAKATVVSFEELVDEFKDKSPGILELLLRDV